MTLGFLSVLFALRPEQTCQRCPKSGVHITATLALFRDGAPLCRIETEMRHTVDWCFSKDGQSAIIGSMALHGPFYFQRVNLAQRKMDAKYTQYATATAHPAWVSEAEQRMQADVDGNYRSATPISLSLAQRRPLNETLRALAAVEMPPFVEGQLPDSSLIRFAVQHTYLNGGGLTVPATRVDALCLRFFSKTVGKHQSVDTIRFDGKAYHVGGGDADEDTRFAVVEQALRVAPDIYQLLVFEYRASGDTKRYLRTPSNRWNTISPERPVLTRQMRCLVRKTKDGSPGYTIEEYLPRAWR
jgi:hypothetical protein